jgi:glycosyltransferase involved in cell wall biosynthesis
MSAAPTRVLFVNSGILGMQSFSKYIREAMAGQPDVDATHINLSEQMTIQERAVRRAMCLRLWRDGWFGLNNVDFARFRHECHAGLQAARRIRKLSGGGTADVIHFHRQATAYASVGLLRRVPGIISIDCTQDAVIDFADSALERWTYRANAAADGRILTAAAAIVSASRWAADCVRRRYPACRTPVYVMPTPVRLQCFDDGWIEQRFRRGAPGYLPRVLFVGGDFVRKGGEDLLAAWQAAELHRFATLDLVTDWPGLSARTIAGVRVRRNVDSYSPEWSDLWRDADLFVMPTRHEAFGVVFQEAAAAGLPRIGTNVNAVPELIADGVSGLLVPPRDPAALVRAIRTLVQSPDLRRRFGLASRARIVESANPEDYRRRLIDVIQMAAGRRDWIRASA